MFNRVSRIFNIEKKFYYNLEQININSKNINSIYELILILDNLIEILNHNNFGKIIDKRKPKDIKDYVFFKNSFKSLNEICVNCLNFLNNKYSNPIAKAKEQYLGMIYFFENISKLIKYNEIETFMKVNEKAVLDLNNVIFRDINDAISLMNLRINSFHNKEKKRGENIFILKNYIVLINFLIKKQKELENIKNSFTKEKADYIIDEILSQNLTNIEGININIEELESFKNHHNYKTIDNINTEFNKLNTKSFDWKFEKNINEVSLNLIKLREFIINFK